MKAKLKLLGIELVIIAAAVMGWASSFMSVGTLSTVNNTTANGTAYQVSSYTGSGAVSVQTAGLTATNACQVNDQVSLDGTNFITVATFWMSATNAGTQIFYPSYSQPIYRRAQVITTNSVQAGVVYQ